MAEAYEAAGLEFTGHAVAITMPGSTMDSTALAEGGGSLPDVLLDQAGPASFPPSAFSSAAWQGLDIDGLLAGASACDEATRQHDARRNPAAVMALAWHHATGGKGQKDMVSVPPTRTDCSCSAGTSSN